MDDSTAIIVEQQVANNDSSNPSGLNLYRKIVLKKKPAVVEVETPPKDESNLSILPSTTENKGIFPYLIV